MNKKNYVIIASVFVVILLVGITAYAINSNNNNTAISPSPSSSNSSSVSTAPQGDAVTLQGTMTCLVPKDTSGAQNMSCAIGLKTDDGKYYALNASDPTTTGSIPTGQRVSVTGTVSEQTSIYDIAGTVKVATIDRI